MAANQTRDDSLTLRIALMDFNLTPLEVMEEELKVERKTIYRHRQDPIYREMSEELKASWKEKMLQTPGTTELRRSISHGLAIAVKKLITILSGTRTPNRDIIAAARLMAQMDGRFLGADTGDSPAHPGETESVASELIQMLKRTQGTVQ